MKKYTTEFEKWWEKNKGKDESPETKALVWLAWRTGREQLWEETASTRLQRVSA